MGRDGSTAEDTFYAKIRPHSLSLQLKPVENTSCRVVPSCENFQTGQGKERKQRMHVNISRSVDRDRRDSEYVKRVRTPDMGVFDAVIR